ncbi:MAG TPA: GntR family transcriptional regulator [Jatrophihabitantaceae bacterium]|jgi:DNA-binding FadR family transcriptional regulator
MPLSEVTRRSVPDDVYEQIVTDVLHGTLSAGEALPSERRLAEVLGVSRPAVREALQRLSHSGVISVRQGDATTVNDFRRHAGMDLLAHLLVRNGELDPAVARSILEARLYIGPFVAELAARRAGADLRSQLDRALAALQHAPDAVARQRASLEFWDVIVDGADSITFRLMYNGLRAAYEPALAALAPLLDAEVSLSAYERLAAAITKGQPTNARRTADDLLRPGSLSLLAALDALEAP